MKGDTKLVLFVLIATIFVGATGGIVLMDIMTEPISAEKGPVGQCASTLKNSDAKNCHILAG